MSAFSNPTFWIAILALVAIALLIAYCARRHLSSVLGLTKATLIVGLPVSLYGIAGWIWGHEAAQVRKQTNTYTVVQAGTEARIRLHPNVSYRVQTLKSVHLRVATAPGPDLSPVVIERIPPLSPTAPPKSAEEIFVKVNGVIVKRIFVDIDPSKWIKYELSAGIFDFELKSGVIREIIITADP